MLAGFLALPEALDCPTLSPYRPARHADHCWICSRHLHLNHFRTTVQFNLFSVVLASIEVIEHEQTKIFRHKPTGLHCAGRSLALLRSRGTAARLPRGCFRRLARAGGSAG